MGTRNVYLENQPWETALAGWLEELARKGGLAPGPAEWLPVEEAAGRVTAGPVYAARSSPHYAAAAMDGLAVQARDTFGASETSPMQLPLGPAAVEVDTGDLMPLGCDAVVRAEEVFFRGDQSAEIIGAVSPWENVRQVGEDVVAHEMLLPGNHLLGAYDIGGLLAGGILRVAVHPRPRVAIIPTGDELVPAAAELEPGQIPDSNSPMLAALVAGWGAEPVRFPLTPDQPEVLEERLDQAISDADLVLINAGSSAGRDDYTAAVVRSLGKVLSHGVAIKPGKPVILGIVREKAVVGVPGYPVSAVLASELFARPVICRRQGLPVPQRPLQEAALARKIYSPLGQEEFLRVKLGQVGHQVIATPIARGAGAVTSLMRADGILRVPRLSEGFTAGEKVMVELLRPLEEILEAVVIIGSHDLSLDILAHHLHGRFSGLALSSANVGSLGGLAALRRGEAHAAGVHLLDPSTGVYNETYVRQYLPGVPAVLVNLAYRQQGLIVARGNPKGIRDLAGAASPGIRFVNRQRGAGTRILLDYLLGRQGIDSSALNGYEREEYTHLAVAVAVAAGAADAGMGIQAAARALGLDFVPFTEERYDLCIPLAAMETGRVRRMVEMMAAAGFKQEVEALGGYDLRDCGKVMWTNE